MRGLEWSVPAMRSSGGDAPPKDIWMTESKTNGVQIFTVEYFATVIDTHHKVTDDKNGLLEASPFKR